MLLLLICGLKMHEIVHELDIGYHRVKNICEDLRLVFCDADEKRSMKIVVRKAMAAGLVPLLVERLQSYPSIMAVVEKRLHNVPRVVLE